MFTKQHYIALAEIIRESADKEEIKNRLTGYLKADNPKFDEKKFLDACERDDFVQINQHSRLKIIDRPSPA